MSGRAIYCVDASALFDLKKFWAPSTFPGVWRSFEGLIADQRIVSPRAVLDEIEHGDDELLSWAREHKTIFTPDTQELFLKTREVLTRFDLVDHRKEYEDADPYVVALAILKNEGAGQMTLGESRSECNVVTSERRNPGGKPTSPTHAKASASSAQTFGVYSKWRVGSSADAGEPVAWGVEGLFTALDRQSGPPSDLQRAVGVQG